MLQLWFKPSKAHPVSAVVYNFQMNTVTLTQRRLISKQTDSLAMNLYSEDETLQQAPSFSSFFDSALYR
jgi:hypothetical protein